MKERGLKTGSNSTVYQLVLELVCVGREGNLKLVAQGPLHKAPPKDHVGQPYHRQSGLFTYAWIQAPNARPINPMGPKAPKPKP